MTQIKATYRSLVWLGACALLTASCSQEDPDDAGGAGGAAGTANTGGAGAAGAAGVGSGGTSGGGGSGGATTGGSGGAGSGGSTGGSGGSTAGSGGGGSGGSSGGMAEEGDYYPMVDGATWTYRHTGGSSTWDEIVMQTTTEYEGAPAVMLIDNAGPSGTHSETVLKEDGGRIYRVYIEEYTGTTLDLSTEYVPGFLRFDRAWQTKPAGFAETAMYDRTEYDGAGAVAGEAQRSHMFTIEALDETVTVPAGTIENCLRVRRARVRAAGDMPADDDVDLFWFCKGIGKVLEESVATGQREELVSCEVPGGECP